LKLSKLSAPKCAESRNWKPKNPEQQMKLIHLIEKKNPKKINGKNPRKRKKIFGKFFKTVNKR